MRRLAAPLSPDPPRPAFSLSSLPTLLIFSLGCVCGYLLHSPLNSCGSHTLLPSTPLPHALDAVSLAQPAVQPAAPSQPLASAAASHVPAVAHPAPALASAASPPAPLATAIDIPSRPVCYFRYSHISEGLGGSISQILNGKVTAALTGKRFCLATALDLVDPDGHFDSGIPGVQYAPGDHSTDNAWLRKYWDGVPRCPEAVGACDVSVEHVHADWETPYVWRLWQLLYRDEFVRLRHSLATAPLSRNYEYCAHIRTGFDDNARTFPNVRWTGVKLHLFGAQHTDYEFCRVNECVLMNRTRSPEFDLVNMANCRHLEACDSSLGINAKLLNRYNTDYVKAARLGNTRYTEYFDSAWQPPGCDSV